MTRQQANFAILDILRSYLTEYPDLRFGQALYNLGIATHRKDSNPEEELEPYYDIFFEESTKTLERFILTGDNELPHTEKLHGAESGEVDRILPDTGTQVSSN